MKKILLALGILVAFGTKASAQDSKFAKNYKVCRSEEGQYGICADQTRSNLNDNNTGATKSYMTAEQAAKAMQVPCYSPISVLSRPPAIPAKKVVKENEYSNQNDGFEQNAKRNLNYGNNTQLAPNTGEIR
jgi:hypothetical protein